MQSQATTEKVEVTAEDLRKSLRAVLRLLDKWECSEKEKMSLLGVSRATLHRYQKNPATVNVTSELAERLSYLLNIHANLGIVFSNPENKYGFIRMANNNYFFNGLSPMEVMLSGRVGDLYEVHRQIDALRGGGW